MRVRLSCLLLLLVVAVQGAEPPKKESVFVGVGYGGRRLVSTDGKEWTIAAEWGEKGGDDSNNLMSVVYAQGKFVAVGGGATSTKSMGHILVSKDGKEWKSVYEAKFRVHPIVYGNDRFVAGGPNRDFLFSKDGEKWEKGDKLTAKEASHFRHGAFGNGVFVFIGNAGGNSPTTWVAVTKDGEKLDHNSADLPPVRGLTFAKGLFVAVGPKGMTMSSKDGIKWNKAEPIGDEDFTWIAWTGKAFICGGGKTPYFSEDGIKWEKWPNPIPCHVMCVTEKGWIGTTWPGQMWHSTDGKKWEKSKAMTPNGINSVQFGQE